MDVSECPKEASADSSDSVPITGDGGAQKKAGSMENVLAELGVPGRYQLIQIIALSSCATPYVFALLSFVFIGYEPPSRCSTANETELLIKNNVTHYDEPYIEYQSCLITVTSNGTGNVTDGIVTLLECEEGYDYNGDKYVSMVSEWDLVCGNDGITGFVQSSVTLGLAIGSVFATYVADRYGRTYVFVFNSAATVLTELGIVFADSIYTVIVLRFLTGLSAGAVYVIHNVISLELLTSKYRQTYGAFSCIVWSFNLMLLSGVAHIMRNNDWRHLEIVTVVSGVPAVLTMCIIYETPTWLIARGQYEKAKRVVIRACKINSKEVSKALCELQKCIGQAKAFSTGNNLSPSRKAKIPLFTICRNGLFMMRVGVLCLTWFSSATIYFGLYMSSSTLAGDRYVNFFIMALLETPSSFVNMVALSYLGRRTVVLIFFAMSGVCLLTSTCLLIAADTKTSHEANVSTAFILLAKFAVGCAYNVLPAYTPELFPTMIRSTGTGLCLSMACLGGMLSPFLIPLFKIVEWAPICIITCLSFLCFLLIWTLPETKGKELPNTIEETVDWK